MKTDSKCGRKECDDAFREALETIHRLKKDANKRCNGWTNYETWLVNLWIDNEQGTHEGCRDAVRDFLSGWEQAEPSREISIPEAQSRRHDVGDMLKEWVEETYDFPTEGLAADLIGAALSEVEWVEIADHWIEAVGEEAA
jgi:hypothetical protein